VVHHSTSKAHMQAITALKNCSPDYLFKCRSNECFQWLTLVIEPHQCIRTAVAPHEAANRLAEQQCGIVTGGQALPSQMAREVVLEAAQHFFKAASSLEAEEIGLGQVALSLLPHDPDVQQHGMSLKALQELQDYGLYLLPADYNQARAAVCCATVIVHQYNAAKGVAVLCCAVLLQHLHIFMRV